MQALSSEVVLRICGNALGSRDLKSLRLVNKRFSALAAVSLFETSIVRFRQESLEGLTSISAHPYLSTLIRKIVYVCKDEDVETYWDQNRPSQKGLHGLAEAPNAVGGRWLVGAILEEAARLAASLTNLSGVMDIQLWLDGAPVDSDMVDSPQPLADLQRLEPGIQQFSALVRASSIAKTSISTFGAFNFSRGLHYSFLEMERCDMQHAIAVFTNLTRIDLYIDTRQGEPASQVVLCKGKLADLLMTARHLRHLSLGFDQRPDQCVELLHILGTGTWEALESLELWAVDFNLWEIKGFLARHLNIVGIGLTDCRLHSRDSRRLLEAIRDIPKLDRVGLGGALGDSTVDFNFFEHTGNRQRGTEFVLGHCLYPKFE
jgi:hypothetical protein